MTRYTGTAILVFCGLLTLHALADAAESQVPEPFQGFDNNSRHTINYDDLSDLLRVVVVDVATSNRAIAPPAKEITGTRMKVKVNKLTANEGNRFFYETFQDNDAGKQYLLDFQKNLETLPSRTPLAKFSRDDQLAYWLNLYNITVVNQIVAVYPQRSLKKLIQGRNSIFSEKLLTVAGIPLSLDDIQFTILKQNYDNEPLIIYGLYQGIIGGPDIRPLAYNGDDVYRALEDNAFEFINSNRGTFIKDEETFRVSSLYDRNSEYFPDFSSDLSQHLLSQLEGNERTALQSASKLKADIDDWTVTDLGGTRQQISRSFAHNNAALMDSFRSNHVSIYGGVMTATLKIDREWPDPDDDREDRDDTDRLDDLESGTVPVEGASVEDVAPEELQE